MFGRKVELPRFTETTSHTEALHRLFYLVDSEAPFASIQGRAGSGRTSVLLQFKEALVRQQILCPLINSAGMDAESLLWHIAAALSLDITGLKSRSELQMGIRDELQGRAHCGLRTVIILDDLDLGFGDIESALKYLTAVASQADGLVTFVASTSDFARAGFVRDPQLVVELPGLSKLESLQFAQSLLGSLLETDQILLHSALPVIVELSEGNPARLTRLCNIIQVVHDTSPSLRIDEHVVREAAREVLPRAVA